MSTQEKARHLMLRQQVQVRNRQQSLLNRAAAELGIDITSLANDNR
jgi:hypothetical protein